MVKKGDSCVKRDVCTFYGCGSTSDLCADCGHYLAESVNTSTNSKKAKSLCASKGKKMIKEISTVFYKNHHGVNHYECQELGTKINEIIVALNNMELQKDVIQQLKAEICEHADLYIKECQYDGFESLVVKNFSRWLVRKLSSL